MSARPLRDGAFSQESVLFLQYAGAAKRTRWARSKPSGMEPLPSDGPLSGASPIAAATARRRGDRAGYAQTLRWIAVRAEQFARLHGIVVGPAFAQACILRFHQRSHLIGGKDDLAVWVDELIGFEFRMRWARSACPGRCRQYTVH